MDLELWCERGLKLQTEMIALPESGLHFTGDVRLRDIKIGAKCECGPIPYSLLSGESASYCEVTI